MEKEIFTKDEIIALKELAEEHIRMNQINHGQKTNWNKPNIFPKDYVGPKSYAAAVSDKWNWDADKQEWIENKFVK